MKKIKYLILLIVTYFVSISALCPGQPSSGYPSTTKYSALIGGNQQEIALMRIGNGQQDELIGLWQTNDGVNKTYSKISFDENGYVQEDIYLKLTGEKLISIEGRYHTQNNKMVIAIVGDFYQFEYLLQEPYLQLTVLSEEFERMK